MATAGEPISIPSDLHSLTRRELQNLCKANAIKANSKTTELVAALEALRTPPVMAKEEEEESLSRMDVDAKPPPSQPCTPVQQKAAKRRRGGRRRRRSSVSPSPPGKNGAQRKSGTGEMDCSSSGVVAEQHDEIKAVCVQGDPKAVVDQDSPIPVSSGQVPDSDLQVADLEPQVADLDPQVADLDPQVADLEPQVADLDPQVADLDPQVADLNPQVPIMDPQEPIADLQKLVDEKQINLGEVGVPTAVAGGKGEEDGNDSEATLQRPTANSRKRVRRSTFEVPQQLSKSGSIALPQITSMVHPSSTSSSSSTTAPPSAAADDSDAPPCKKVRANCEDDEQQQQQQQKQKQQQQKQKQQVTGNHGDGALKENLLKFLDRKVQERKEEIDGVLSSKRPLPAVGKSSRIPLPGHRNFDKIHKRNAAKTESIVDYDRKKRLRMAALMKRSSGLSPAVKKATPHPPTMNTGSKGAQPKPTPGKFNLQESLNKPLPYTPHSGRMKP